MVEICSCNLARTPIKTHKGDKKWPFFVNKQLFWWSTSITLDNNNAVLTDLQPFFSLNILPHASVGLTSCIPIVCIVLNILTHLTTICLLGHFNTGLNIKAFEPPAHRASASPV